MDLKFKELKPMHIALSEYEDIEKEIKKVFLEEMYLPLMRIFSDNKKLVKNSKYDLLEALRTGRITFNRGKFSGKMSSVISKELRSIGATFDRKDGTYNIPRGELSYEIRSAISASLTTFEKKVASIDKILSQNLPEEIAGKMKIEKMFDSALYKTESNFQASVKNITVPAQFNPAKRKMLSEEWSENMNLWVKDFGEAEIKRLRKDLEKSIFAGNRYGSAIGSIQKSFGVTERKAKFLARQETSLAIAKYRKARYTDSGVLYYKWGCVAGTKEHPVRPWHKSLEGKVFRYDDPPVTTEPGTAQRRNNPHEDYNCRCFDIPMVGYRETK